MSDEIAFFDFNEVGGVVEFGAIILDRNTLIQKSEQSFLINRNQINDYVHDKLFQILHGKIWMVYHKNINDLMNLFHGSRYRRPIAKYQIDTKEWFVENFGGKIDNMSFESFREYFNLEVEESEEQSSYKVARDCHLHIQVIKASMGITQLKALLKKKEDEALLKKKEDEEKEAKEKNINENQKKKEEKLRWWIFRF